MGPSEITQGLILKLFKVSITQLTQQNTSEIKSWFYKHPM
jgi:hypothetical protein